MASWNIKEKGHFNWRGKTSRWPVSHQELWRPEESDKTVQPLAEKHGPHKDPVPSGDTSTLSYKGKLRDCVASRPVLQEVPKGILLTKETMSDRIWEQVEEKCGNQKCEETRKSPCPLGFWLCLMFDAKIV